MTRQTGPARLDPSPAARPSPRLPRRPRPLDPWTLAVLTALTEPYAARHGDTPAVTGRRRDQLRAAATRRQAGRVAADGGAR